MELVIEEGLADWEFASRDRVPSGALWTFVLGAVTSASRCLAFFCGHQICMCVQTVQAKAEQAKQEARRRKEDNKIAKYVLLGAY